MKIRHILKIFYLMIFIQILNTQVNAAGVGINISGSYGQIDLAYDGFNSSSNMPKAGFGFLYDTVIARNSIFNNRFNIGYNYAKLDNERITDIKASDFYLTNTFGFCISQNENYRLWFGPQIGAGVLFGKYDSTTDSMNEFFTGYGSLGFLIGVNLHLTDTFSLGFDGGFKISYHMGKSRFDNTYDTTGNVKGLGKEGIINLNFIIRYDNYSALSNKKDLQYTMN